MRNLILSSFVLFFLTSTFVGCTKQVEIKDLPTSVEEEYQSADQQIEKKKMLDALENGNVPLERKRIILCNQYPEVYKKKYMSALLILSPHNYTEETLTRDFEAVINFYKKAFMLNCD